MDFGISISHSGSANAADSPDWAWSMVYLLGVVLHLSLGSLVWAGEPEWDIEIPKSMRDEALEMPE